MNNKKIREIQKELEEIIEDLKPYKPEKIFLYGSHAREEAREGSDIDLLIIKDTKKRVLDRLDDVIDLLYPKSKMGLNFSRFDLDIDPLILTPKELEERKENNFFIKEILNDANLIYEK